MKHHLEAKKMFNVLGIFAAQALQPPNKIKKHFPVAKRVQKVRCVQKGFQHIPKSEKRSRRLELFCEEGGIVESCLYQTSYPNTQDGPTSARMDENAQIFDFSLDAEDRLNVTWVTWLLRCIST